MMHTMLHLHFLLQSLLQAYNEATLLFCKTVGMSSNNSIWKEASVDNTTCHWSECVPLKVHVGSTLIEKDVLAYKVCVNGW